MGRDVAQWLASRIGEARGDYRCVEFHGDYVEGLDQGGKHTLCNAMVDIGVKAAVCPARDTLGAVWESDVGASFADELAFDVPGLALQICLPPNPLNAVPLVEAAGQHITSAFIGSCIGGKMEDLRAAAEVRRGRHGHPDVRLTVQGQRSMEFDTLNKTSSPVDSPGPGATHGLPAG